MIERGRRHDVVPPAPTASVRGGLPAFSAFAGAKPRTPRGPWWRRVWREKLGPKRRPRPPMSSVIDGAD